MWKEVLQNKALTLRRSVYKLEEQIHTDCVTIEMRKNIGKCFTYRNCYSCPQPESYWTLYKKILRIKNGNYVVESFQKDMYGKFTIEKERVYGQGTLVGCTEIPSHEYNKAKKNFLAELTKELKT